MRQPINIGFSLFRMYPFLKSGTDTYDFIIFREKKFCRSGELLCNHVSDQIYCRPFQDMIYYDYQYSKGDAI